MLNTDIPLSDSQSPADEMVHWRGSAVACGRNDRARIDIPGLMRQLGPNCLEPAAVDEFLGDNDVDFAPDRAEIEMIFRAGAHVVVQLHLHLPTAVDAVSRDFVLPPLVLDGALHCAAALIGNSSHRLPVSLPLPHAVAVMHMDAPCTDRMFVWVRCAQGSPATKLDVDLCDMDGNVCAQAHGVAYDEMLRTRISLS